MAVEDEHPLEIKYRVVSPSMAAKGGIFPREYLEVDIDVETWNGNEGQIITAQLQRKLDSGHIVIFKPTTFQTAQGGAVFDLYENMVLRQLIRLLDLWI